MSKTGFPAPFVGVLRTQIDEAASLKLIGAYMYFRRFSNFHTGEILETLSFIGRAMGCQDLKTPGVYLRELAKLGMARLEGPPGRQRWFVIPPEIDVVQGGQAEYAPPQKTTPSHAKDDSIRGGPRKTQPPPLRDEPPPTGGFVPLVSGGTNPPVDDENSSLYTARARGRQKTPEDKEKAEENTNPTEGWDVAEIDPIAELIAQNKTPANPRRGIDLKVMAKREADRKEENQVGRKARAVAAKQAVAAGKPVSRPEPKKPREIPSVVSSIDLEKPDEGEVAVLDWNGEAAQEARAALVAGEEPLRATCGLACIEARAVYGRYRALCGVAPVPDTTKSKDQAHRFGKACLANRTDPASVIAWWHTEVRTRRAPGLTFEVVPLQFLVESTVERAAEAIRTVNRKPIGGKPSSRDTPAAYASGYTDLKRLDPRLVPALEEAGAWWNVDDYSHPLAMPSKEQWALNAQAVATDRMGGRRIDADPDVNAAVEIVIRVLGGVDKTRHAEA